MGPNCPPCFPGTGGQGFTLYFPEVRARLSGFHASRCQGAGARASALLPALLSGDRGPVSAVRGPGASRLSGGQAFRGPGFRSASMLSGGQGQGFLHAFRRQGFLYTFRGPCFPRASRGPGIFKLFFFVTSSHFVFASQPPCFQAFRRQWARGQASRPDFPYIK